MKLGPFLFLLTSLIFAAAGQTKAAIILDSADGNDTTAGAAVSDQFWRGHRFEVTNAVDVTSVGGTFDNGVGPDVIFAAIVKLSGPFDFPDSADLSTIDVLATTTFTVPKTTPALFVSTPLSTSLTPGWHALVFGTGAFSSPSGGAVHMPSLSIDNEPTQTSFVIRQSQQDFLSNTNGLDFVVESSVVPEPTTLAIWGIGVIGLAGYGWRRRRKVA